LERIFINYSVVLGVINMWHNFGISGMD